VSITKEILNFYKKIEDDYFHRYKSWEHCYSYFKTNLNKSIDYEYASLQLAFYLASWGMYRGSTVLFWKDYKIHIDLLRDIFLKYKKLYKINIRNEEMFDEYSNTIYLAANEIKEYYNKNIKYKDGGKIKYEPTDTLATKILLGIYGCIPAFDRYFKKGLKVKTKSRKYISTEIEDIKKVFLYLKENNDSIFIAEKYINNKSNIKYTKMKLLDMYLWNVGKKAFEKEKKLRKNKKS
jgi:hypothetical protein